MTQDPRPRPPDGDVPGYAAALDELTAILAELEADDVDVDVLAERVGRAAELIAVCRDRIDAARFQVERIVAGLAAPDAPASPAPAGSPSAADAGSTPTADERDHDVPLEVERPDPTDGTLRAAYDEPDVDGAGA